MYKRKSLKKEKGILVLFEKYLLPYITYLIKVDW